MYPIVADLMRPHQGHGEAPVPDVDEDAGPVMICLLGSFRVLKWGAPVTMRGGGKAETLLLALALRHRYSAPRETLLHRLWPDQDMAPASRSLNSLVYSLHKLLGDALGGAPAIACADGVYRLNHGAGVAVDIDRFDQLVLAAERQARAGNHEARAALDRQAARLYRGNIESGLDLPDIVERERVRTLCLTLLARLAAEHRERGEADAALRYARRMIELDPCREDGHRLAMRCYVALGERAQALRQYRLCESALRVEFDAVPEPATTALFDQIRTAPQSV